MLESAMRLAVLADIHGNLVALDAVLQNLEAAGGADKIWVLGDLCASGGRPAECLERVRSLPNVEVISGNTDRYLIGGQRQALRARDESEWRAMPDRLIERESNFSWAISKLSYADYEYLASLGSELELHVPGYGWVIGYHGVPGSDEGLMWPDTPDEEVLDQFTDREGRLGFGGHTHVPMDRDLGLWRVVNVGSVGLPKDEPRASYALVTFADGVAQVDLRRVAYDLDVAIDDLRAQEHPYWQEIADILRCAAQP
jgi:predicted phosphodiesterase